MIRFIFFGFLFILALSLYNVAIIKWGTGEGSRSWQSTLWHVYGGIVRALPAIFILWYLWGNWIDMLTFCLVYIHMGWTGYDGVVNLGRGLNFFYQGSSTSGTGSWIDRTFPPVLLKIVKLVLFVGTLIFILITSLIPLF